MLATAVVSVLTLGVFLYNGDPTYGVLFVATGGLVLANLLFLWD